MTPHTFAFNAESSRALAHGLLAQVTGLLVASQLALRTSLPRVITVLIATVAALVAVAIALRARRPPPPKLVLRTVTHTLFGGGVVGFVACGAILGAPDGLSAFRILVPYAFAFVGAGVIGYVLLRFVLYRETAAN